MKRRNLVVVIVRVINVEERFLFCFLLFLLPTARVLFFLLTGLLDACADLLALPASKMFLVADLIPFSRRPRPSCCPRLPARC